MLLLYNKLVCNSCKCMDAFKIKCNFYYKNINFSQITKKKKYLSSCNTCIRIDKFKIKYIFYQ